MPIPFVEERFPTEISYGSKGGPSFRTTVFESEAGFEQRNREWAKARCRYDASYGITDKDNMKAVLDFFYNMGGKATGFRWKDWSDYRIVAQNIGTGNGVALTFQIIKTYIVGAQTYTREIKKPVAHADSPFTVTVGGTPLTYTTDYTVDATTGIITFTSPPADLAAIAVTCQFDVPVRFDTDEMMITLEAFEQQVWDAIPIVEIRPQS